VAIDFYPADGDTGQGLNQVVTAVINKPLDPATVTLDNAFLTDEFQDPIPGYLNYQEVFPYGVITFVPQNLLDANSLYVMNLTTGLADVTGNSLVTLYSWAFRTTTLEGTYKVLDDFEVWDPHWMDPNWSGSTQGVNPDSTYFRRSAEVLLRGNYSAKLAYEFTEPSGFIRVFYNDITDPGATPGKFGPKDRLEVFIFGDGSGNQFRFCLDDNESGYEVSDWFTIDWIGWRKVSLDLAKDPVYGWVTGNGVIDGPQLDLDSFHFRRAGTSKGVLYLDDLTVVTLPPTSVKEPPPVASQPPTTFRLEQSYPNPLRVPGQQTLISYQLPGNSSAEGYWTHLWIVNERGQRVRTLVRRYQAPGRYQVWWDGRDDYGRPVSSGIYFYFLQAGPFRAAKKLVIIR